jgi:glycerophosphoryl diester phosphodiesterase
MCPFAEIPLAGDAVRRESGVSVIAALYRVVESASFAKSGRDEENEDVIVLTPAFAAVIDGATDQSGLRYDGLTGGRFAARSLAVAFADLDPEADLDTAIDFLTAGLAAAVRRAGGDPTAWLCPTASLVCYAGARREIWRVGDCAFRLDGQVDAPITLIDRVASEARATLDRALLASGVSLAQICATDPGRDLILPLLRVAGAFQNHPNPDCEFGRGVLDGKRVPAHFRERFPVGDATELVLTSDGYPQLCATLAASERALSHALAIDPLRISFAHPETKGMTPGARSFDDRTYLRLAL